MAGRAIQGLCMVLCAVLGTGLGMAAVLTAADATAQTTGRTFTLDDDVGTLPDGAGGGTQAGDPAADAATARAAEEISEITVRPFLLRPGDVVRIQVLEDSSLDRELLIQPDGRVAFPLAGIVEASGITTETLQERVRSALSEDFLEPPTVTVTLVSSRTIDEIRARQRTFFVFGQVRNAGQFPLPPNKEVSVLQALALAGGPDVFAATGRIQIRRRNPETGAQELTLFDYEAIEDGELLPDLEPLRDGDVIFIPERGLFE